MPMTFIKFAQNLVDIGPGGDCWAEKYTNPANENGSHGSFFCSAISGI